MLNADHQNDSTPDPPTTKLDFSSPARSRKNDLKPAAQRAVKLRLLSLLGLLVLVIVAMKEAGKPERWMWLGFDTAGDSALVSDAEIGDGSIVLKDSSTANRLSDRTHRSENEDLPGGGLGFMSDRIASRLEGRELDRSAESDRSEESDRFETINNAAAATPPDPQLSPVAIDFWRSAFLRLTTAQQDAFYQLLRRVALSKVAASSADLPFDATINQISDWHRQHQTQTLGQLAVMSASDSKTKLTEQLFAFDKSWIDHVLPTLKASAAGEDFTIANQSAVKSVKSTIDPIVLKNVQDLTGMGNADDKKAWLAIWDHALADHLSGYTSETPPVSLLQLKGQPGAFRGQRVAIEGNALTIRRKDLSQTLLEIDHYYEMWVAPSDAVTSDLICIYVAELPDEFSQTVDDVSEQFQSIELPVSLAGRFFKIRSYQDASKSVSHCPVVVAATFAASFPASGTNGAGTWQPSLVVWILFLIIAMTAAVGIAYAVLRSTQSGTESVVGDSTVSPRLSRSLDALTGDDSIMTDAQRVGQLGSRLDDETGGVLADEDLDDEEFDVGSADDLAADDTVRQSRQQTPDGEGS